MSMAQEISLECKLHDAGLKVEMLRSMLMMLADEHNRGHNSGDNLMGISCSLNDIQETLESAYNYVRSTDQAQISPENKIVSL